LSSNNSSGNPTGPTLTVIVPARNEEAVLPVTLPRIIDGTRNVGTLGQMCEVIVVVPEESLFAKQPPMRSEGLRWITTDVPGKYEALRCGVSHARGRHLIFVDADVAPHPSALGHLWAALRDEEVDAAAGRIVLHQNAPLKQQSVTHRALEFWTEVNFEAWHRLRQTRPDLRWALPGAMYALDRRWFPTDGLLVPTLDDASIGLHMFESGARIAYVPAATVQVVAASSVRQWYSQKLRVRRGWKLLKEVRPNQVSAIQATLSTETDRLCAGSKRARLMQRADRVMALVAEHSPVPQAIRVGSWSPDRRGSQIATAADHAHRKLLN